MGGFELLTCNQVPAYIWLMPLFRRKRAALLDTLEEPDSSWQELWHSSGPAGFLVKIHPEQSYFPKISSCVTPEGSMKSQPLHKMSPPLEEYMAAMAFKYFGTESS